MDLQNAVVLLAVAGGLVELLKGVLPDVWIAKRQVLVLLCIVAGFASTFALRYSVWAHEQVVGGKPLDELAVGSLIVVSLFVATTECAAFLILKGAGGAVANVGENQPKVMSIEKIEANLKKYPDTHSGQANGGGTAVSTVVTPADWPMSSAADDISFWLGPEKDAG